jgi:hypothetical protein
MTVENIKKPTIFHDIGKGRIDPSFHEIQRRKEGWNNDNDISKKPRHTRHSHIECVGQSGSSE